MLAISVVIPCHNGGTYLRQTIGSVLAQTQPPAEIVVVLDHSTDESLDIIRSFDSRVRYVEVDLRSAAAARNLGAQLASGQALMFLDADDVLGPTALQSLAKGLAAIPDGIALCPWFRLELDAGTWVCRPPSVPSGQQPDDLLGGWLKGWYYPPCSILWSRDALQRAGGWGDDITVNDDGDLMFRALAEGVNHTLVPDGAAYYRRVPNGASLSGQRLTPGGLASQLTVYERLAVRLAHKGTLRIYRQLLTTALASERERCAAAGYMDLAERAGELIREFGSPPRRRVIPAAQRIVDRMISRVSSRRRGIDHLDAHQRGLNGPVVFGLADSGRPSDGVGKATALAAVQQPCVSVIIPTYNRAELVARAIRSVLAQTFTDYELLVIDDGSTDETAAVVAGFGDRRVRYLRQPRNRGVSEARNRGLREARGEFIAFLDSDDGWEPAKLAQQIALFRASPSDVGLIYTGAQILTSTGFREERPRHRGAILNQLLQRNVIVGGSVNSVIRRSAMTAAGFFDPDLPAMEDYDYWLRVARFYKVDFVDELLVRYYDTDHGERRSRDRKTDMAARDALYRRYFNTLRARQLECRFLLISAERRLTWIPPPDRIGALTLTIKACIADPRCPDAYRQLARRLIPGRFRNAVRAGIRVAG